jgi:NADPH:quinone reductase-like Zn-dependent oxidoreductase
VKAALRDRFGPPEAVEVRGVDKPVPADDEVLVRVHTASLNMTDWYSVTGRPWIARPTMGMRKPKELRLGADYAGTVETVGKSVTQFRPGDEVFGARTGALAEYVAAREDRAIVTKPANVTFEEAAATPVAAVTALQGLRDKGRLEPGQRVLINGASGGVGTFAVSFAKALGANVTAICGPRGVEIARALGADRVVDYTREDFTRSGERYDLLLDIAGTRSWAACKRVLERDATVVVVGGSRKNRLVGPLGHVARMRLGGLFGSRKVVFFLAELGKDELVTLRELLETGQVKPVIDRRFGLSEIGDAFRYMGEGHPQGKIVVTV